MFVILEATIASPIEQEFVAPLAPLQKFTIPEGPEILLAPITIMAASEHKINANDPVLAKPAQFLARSALVPVSAPLPDAAPLANSPPAPRVVGTARHSQDEFGNYEYSRRYVISAEPEIHTTDRVTRGSYSYINHDGTIIPVDWFAVPVESIARPATVVNTPESSAFPEAASQVAY